MIMVSLEFKFIAVVRMTAPATLIRVLQMLAISNALCLSRSATPHFIQTNPSFKQHTRTFTTNLQVPDEHKTLQQRFPKRHVVKLTYGQTLIIGLALVGFYFSDHTLNPHTHMNLPVRVHVVHILTVIYKL